MSDSFRLVALPAEHFAPLFDKSDEELRALGAKRLVIDEDHGGPCRVSLVDAGDGETVLLLNFTHHDVATPYRGSGPIFVRRGAKTAEPAPGEIPRMFHKRLLSVRAYDKDAMLVASDVVEGSRLEESIRRFFADPAVEYLHLHNAKPGCFNCRVERVGS